LAFVPWKKAAREKVDLALKNGAPIIEDLTFGWKLTRAHRSGLKMATDRGF